MSARPLLTLCMIVKDEAHGIARTLRSAKPWVDRWVICDTGSTDGTQTIVRGELEGVPGMLWSDVFVDFSWNRNALLERASDARMSAGPKHGEPTEFLLLLDADDVLEGGEALRAWLQNEVDGEAGEREGRWPAMPAEFRRDREALYLRMSEGACEWSSARVVRASAVQRVSIEPAQGRTIVAGPGRIHSLDVVAAVSEGWHYVGAVHEVLVHPSGRVPTITIPGVSIRHERPPQSRERLRARLERDAKLLHTEIERDPKNARAVFYLAQTFKRMGDAWRDALYWFEVRVGMGGWREEVFESMLEAGRLAGGGQGMRWLLEAHAFSPHRAEPLVELADHFRLREQPGASFTFARRAFELPYPTGDVLFVDREAYTWKAADRCAISAWYVGEHEIGERAARQALRGYLGPEPNRCTCLNGPCEGEEVGGCCYRPAEWEAYEAREESPEGKRLRANLRFYEERKAAR